MQRHVLINRFDQPCKICELSPLHLGGRALLSPFACKRNFMIKWDQTVFSKNGFYLIVDFFLLFLLFICDWYAGCFRTKIEKSELFHHKRLIQ